MTWYGVNIEQRIRIISILAIKFYSILLPISAEKTAICLHIINICLVSFIRRVELREIFSCAWMELYCYRINSSSIFIGRYCVELRLPPNKEWIVKNSAIVSQAKSHGNILAFVSQFQHIVTCIFVFKQVFIDHWFMSRCHLLELDNPEQECDGYDNEGDTTACHRCDVFTAIQSELGYALGEQV